MVKRSILLAGLVLLALAAAPSARAADTAPAPVVVELFTSQGCSSCPPADRLLGELAGRDDVVALSLHVDYWDYIGWADPYAQAQFTRRQQDYVRRLDARYVYTPQMVVDGTRDVVGSRRNEVMAAIAAERRAGKPLAPRFETGGDGGATLVIPAGDAAGPATVWLALYDSKHETRVPRGENAGDTLANYNVVRDFRRLAAWTGRRLEIPLDVAQAVADGRDGCAVLVQADGTGEILGAAAMPLTGGS